MGFAASQGVVQDGKDRLARVPGSVFGDRFRARGGAVDQARGVVEFGVVLEGQGAFRARGDEPGGLDRAGPDPNLGPALGFGWTLYLVYAVPPALIGFMLLQVFRFAIREPRGTQNTPSREEDGEF